MHSSILVNSPTKGTDCPICNGRGLIIIRDGWDVSARQCRCMEQRKLANILKNSRITPAFQKLSFDNFDATSKPEVVKVAFNTASNYADQFDEIKEHRSNSMIFLGQPGVGKTHLSCAIANNIMTKGVTVLYFPHREGFSELKDSLRNGDKRDPESDYGRKIRAMKNTELLIWDDLYKGRGTPTDFELDTTFEVINYRYLNHLPIVISSEKLPKELLTIDQAIGSRILEMAKGHMVIFESDPLLNHRLA